jgi:hypothetical protein
MPVRMMNTETASGPDDAGRRLITIQRAMRPNAMIIRFVHVFTASAGNPDMMPACGVSQ